MQYWVTTTTAKLILGATSPGYCCSSLWFCLVGFLRMRTAQRWGHCPRAALADHSLPKSSQRKGKAKVHTLNWSAFLISWIIVISVSVEPRLIRKRTRALQNFLNHIKWMGILILNINSEAQLHLYPSGSVGATLTYPSQSCPQRQTAALRRSAGSLSNAGTTAGTALPAHFSVLLFFVISRETRSSRLGTRGSVSTCGGGSKVMPDSHSCNLTKAIPLEHSSERG